MVRARDLINRSKSQTLPIRMSEVEGWDEITEQEADSLKARMRSAYQRAYYSENRETAKQYAREYHHANKSNRKTRSKSRHAAFTEQRESIRMVFNPSEIMRAPTEKAQWMFEHILAGTRGLVV